MTTKTTGSLCGLSTIPNGIRTFIGNKCVCGGLMIQMQILSTQAAKINANGR